MGAGTARIALGTDEAAVATGIAILDHLLGELARSGRLGLSLELAPDAPEAEVEAAGTALGEACRPLLRADGARGRGVGIVPADEALAMVVLEASARALVVSNADLTASRAGGLRRDLVAAFLGSFADAAGLTIHVRLLEGESSEHVLLAIFKALGEALAEALAPVGARS
ncbi:MAG: imidazoleglycerol-phosphate dehydratase [Gaiellaceae bacterium]|nr:MAG: imidazoleglycerol-phosphate dehydratase [Gaiellaceae bacterium]